MIFVPPQTKIQLPPELDEIARQAAEKMPLKAAHKELAAKLTADLDAALQAAVERYLGHPLTDPEIVVGRLTNARVQEDAGETYCMDGVPILWAGDIVIERVDDTLRAHRQLIYLNGTAKGLEQ